MSSNLNIHTGNMGSKYRGIYIQGVPGGNVPDFGRMFLKLK